MEDAGLNLLLRDLETIVEIRDTSQPLRIIDQGILWPELPRPTQPDEWP